MGLLTEVLLRGLPTRDDRLQEDRVLVLDVRLRAKRYGELAVARLANWRAKAGTAPGTRTPRVGRRRRAGRCNQSGFGCSRMSSRSPRSMWKTMSSNPMPRSALSFAFFARQAKYFTAISAAQRVPATHTLASALVCPPVCPNALREPSSGSQRQPRDQ